MLNYLKKFLSEFEYEETDCTIILNAYETVSTCKEANEILNDIIARYNKDMYTNWDELMELMDKISELTGIHIYTVSLLSCICLSEKLKEYYKNNGFSEELWHNTLLDVKYKTKECNLVKGICGTFVCGWLYYIFVLKLFALGRLQFMINTLRCDYNKGGFEYKTGDPVVDIHIPRTETPLYEDQCIESYNQAKEFFKDKFTEKPIPFVCSSWLLMKENKEMLSERSNIRKFINHFEILYQKYKDQGDYSEAWRLFDMDYTGNLEDFPEDTSFRRAFKEYLKSGGRIGSSYGIFLM